MTTDNAKSETPSPSVFRKIVSRDPHHEEVTFDRIEVRQLDRWKESELSGDEYRYSIHLEFWQKGRLVHESRWCDIESVMLNLGHQHEEARKKTCSEEHRAWRETLCDHPGCAEEWTVLFTKVADWLSPMSLKTENTMVEHTRAFCDRHKHRGDCGLDDADANYVVREKRSLGKPL
jgi:hypothetical protein